jgi:hypothetical protein
MADIFRVWGGCFEGLYRRRDAGSALIAKFHPSGRSKVMTSFSERVRHDSQGACGRHLKRAQPRLGALVPDQSGVRVMYDSCRGEGRSHIRVGRCRGKRRSPIYLSALSRISASRTAALCNCCFTTGLFASKYSVVIVKLSPVGSQD